MALTPIADHGVTAATPSNIPLGAGVFYRDLTFVAAVESVAAHWAGNLLGATSGGNKLDIKGDLVDLDIDGVAIKARGLTVMNGGSATMEANMAELTTDIINTSIIGEKITTGDDIVAGYDLHQVKKVIEAGDYLENFAFVGKTADGSKNIIVIFDYALCTSGLSIEGKTKEGSVMKLTMEAYGDIAGDLSRVPCRIYYPTVVA